MILYICIMKRLDKQSKDALWCEYSDLPSPLAYANCADYDSMGNHGRFPMRKEKTKTSSIKKFLKQLIKSK